jgi:hypothetical protein
MTARFCLSTREDMVKGATVCTTVVAFQPVDAYQQGRRIKTEARPSATQTAQCDCGQSSFTVADGFVSF